MNNSWIKLYRKVGENGIMKDHLAWILFSWLLINVDKNTGKKKIGRYMIYEATAIKPNTFYKILKRLATKWQVIDVKTANNWTEVWIVNWAKYQSGNVEEATDRQSSDNDRQIIVKSSSNEETTIQEYKNKEYKNIESITPEVVKVISSDYKIPESVVLLNLEKLKNYQGKKYRDYNKALRNWVLRDAEAQLERRQSGSEKRGGDYTHLG